MASEIAILVLSLLVCCAIAYILGLFWFSDTRNRRLSSLFCLGAELFAWTLLNALSVVCRESLFAVVYSMRMAAACVVPFGVLWFALCFSGSPLRKKRWICDLLVVLPALDVFSVVANRMHFCYFSNYDYPVPGRAPLFWVHLGLGFAAVAVAAVVLARFVFWEAPRSPLLTAAFFGMLAACAVNFMDGLGVRPIMHDVAPLAFFCVFSLFFGASYRLRLLNLRTALYASAMDSLDSVIVAMSAGMVVMDANRAARRAFPDFSIEPGRTHAAAFLAYLSERAERASPEDFVAEALRGEGFVGECSILSPEGGKRDYAMSLNVFYDGGRKSGHVLAMTDVSQYKDMIREADRQNAEFGRRKAEAEFVALAQSRAGTAALSASELRSAAAPAGQDMDAAGSWPFDQLAGCFAGRRALVADDLEINRDMIEAMLAPTAMEIDFAENGAEAVRMFEDNPERYDVVLMDVQMPVMDGFEATRRIRAHGAPGARAVPIIAMTAGSMNDDEEGDRRRCLEAGMDAYLPKPFYVGRLAALLSDRFA